MSTLGELDVAVVSGVIGRIVVAKGTYKLPQPLRIARNVTVDVEGKGMVVLDANRNGPVFEIEAGGRVELTGLSITGGNESGVVIQAGGHANLLDCKIYQNQNDNHVSIF